MLRMYKKVMLGNVRPLIETFPDLKWNESVVLWTIAVVIIIMGVYPKPVMDLVEPAMQAILNKTIIR